MVLILSYLMRSEKPDFLSQRRREKPSTKNHAMSRPLFWYCLRPHWRLPLAVPTCTPRAAIPQPLLERLVKPADFHIRPRLSPYIEPVKPDGYETAAETQPEVTPAQNDDAANSSRSRADSYRNEANPSLRQKTWDKPYHFASRQPRGENRAVPQAHEERRRTQLLVCRGRR